MLCLVVQQRRSGILVCVHFFCARGSLRSRTAESNSVHARPSLRGNSQRPAACKVPRLCVATQGPEPVALT